MSINNAVSESNMGQTESETIQETTMENMSGVIYKLLRQVTELELRLNKVERAYDALGRRLEGSERHVEDEGWFD
jgi:predicted RNase H-like nuclease (RuvC/YqgF family)